jgi:hypothetical protein
VLVGITTVFDAAPVVGKPEATLEFVVAHEAERLVPVEYDLGSIPVRLEHAEQPGNYAMTRPDDLEAFERTCIVQHRSLLFARMSFVPKYDSANANISLSAKRHSNELTHILT